MKDFEVMGYILKNGQDMEWTDDMNEIKLMIEAAVTKDICDRLKMALESLTNVPGDEMDCQLVSLFAHPNRGYLHLSFDGEEDVMNSDYLRGLPNQLYELFNNVTKKNIEKDGPVAGRMQQHVVDSLRNGHIAIRIGLEVYENGEFIGWRSEFNHRDKLMDIESSICDDVVIWAKQFIQLQQSIVHCSVKGPHRIFAVGYFQVLFNSMGSDSWNKSLVISAFESTKANPWATYDITSAHYRFSKYC
ncbi:unnamed protein product [Dicrocoelium dendriticum]|nr:unnamed protein product [Dicrocoelium dendriticum]